jgi:hypothetical protein
MKLVPLLPENFFQDKNMKSLFRGFVLFVFMVITASCSLFPVEQTAGEVTSVKATPWQSGKGYPTSPEGVVQAFLVAYQEEPEMMLQYLDQSVFGGWTPESIVENLHFNGMIDSFAIRNATVNNDPAEAVVVVDILISGELLQRSFLLTPHDLYWTIYSITRFD